MYYCACLLFSVCVFVICVVPLCVFLFVVVVAFDRFQLSSVVSCMSYVFGSFVSVVVLFRLSSLVYI